MKRWISVVIVISSLWIVVVGVFTRPECHVTQTQKQSIIINFTIVLLQVCSIVKCKTLGRCGRMHCMCDIRLWRCRRDTQFFFLFLFWTHDGNTRKSSHLWGWCGNRLLLSNDYMLCKLCTVHERWIWSGCMRISTLWAILRVILFTYFHFDEVNIRWFEDCVYGFETEKCVRALSCNVILSRRQSQTGHTLYKNVVFYSVFICFFSSYFYFASLGFVRAICNIFMRGFWFLFVICGFNARRDLFILHFFYRMTVTWGSLI